MKKYLILISLGLIILAETAFTVGLIDPGASNKRLSTAGYEKNQYDWLIDPVDFSKIEKSTVFFSMDDYADQFGVNTAGYGFRGGFAWIMDGFSPLFAINYLTNASSTIQTNDNNENTEYDYGTFDTASGRYATIDEIVDIATSRNPYHKLMVHFGGKLNGPLNFAIQTYWYMDRQSGDSTSYTDTYSNTAAVSDASLSSKGNLTETLYDLISNRDNVLALDLEAGLNIGNISSTIALGTELYNLGTADDSYSQTVTSYNAGVDPTLMDQQTVTTYTGSYYYNGSPQADFDMNTSTPNYIQRYAIALDTDTTIPLNESLQIEAPVYFDISLAPALSTVKNNTTIGYNDANDPISESTRTQTITTTNLTVNYDINWGIGSTLKKTWKPSENSAFYTGAGVDFAMRLYSDTRNRTKQTQTQVDNNADGAYTTAGTDVDTTYTESGWEIQTRENDYTIILGLPIGISYSPVKSLTFHAGTVTSMSVSLTNSSSLETGDANYIYETYTDNLTAANSYAQRQKNNSNNTSTPSSEFTSDFNFSTSGSFGFTLAISDGFTIDALATTDSMSFNRFSLMAIYSY